MSRAFRADDAGPDDPVVGPSGLVEKVLALLEGAGCPTQTNDQIVGLIEEWERCRDHPPDVCRACKRAAPLNAAGWCQKCEDEIEF
jgi:hypothetical protein